MKRRRWRQSRNVTIYRCGDHQFRFILADFFVPSPTAMLPCKFWMSLFLVVRPSHVLVVFDDNSIFGWLAQSTNICNSSNKVLCHYSPTQWINIPFHWVAHKMCFWLTLKFYFKKRQEENPKHKGGNKTKQEITKNKWKANRMSLLIWLGGFPYH